MPPVLVPRHSEFAPGHSLLPYQQIPEPNMPHNVSFNQNGYPGPHSPYGPQAPPHSPISNVPSPGSSNYNPHSPIAHSPVPHPLGPETPPPAYSPRDDNRLDIREYVIINCQLTLTIRNGALMNVI